MSDLKSGVIDVIVRQVWDYWKINNKEVTLFSNEIDIAYQSQLSDLTAELAKTLKTASEYRDKVHDLRGEIERLGQYLKINGLLEKYMGLK